jgi:hypothetical protein
MAGAKRGPRKIEEITDPVLRRIFEVMPRWKSQHDLCRELGVDESNFSTARVAGRTIPIAILERVAWRSDCRMEWLRTGAAPQFEEGKGPLVSSLSDDIQEAIRLMRDVPARVHATLARVARLLVANHPKPMVVLESALTMDEHGPRAARLLHEDVPDSPAD